MRRGSINGKISEAGMSQSWLQNCDISMIAGRLFSCEYEETEKDDPASF